MAGFDYVVVTASTPKQQEDYRQLVQRRVEAGLYPPEPRFRFYSDPQGGRVGSGGGTLLALAELCREEAGCKGCGGEDLKQVAAFLATHRVLVLHAGGESRRLPCYVPEGKLFAPLALPRSVCGAAVPPVVLDLLLQLYSKYPWAEGEVIMACGDVILDFDAAPFHEAVAAGKYRRGDICGFGKATSFAQGSRHGVFAFDNAAFEEGVPTLPVRDFHQKSKPEILEQECALAASPGNCAVDMGIFSLGPRWVESFLAFAGAPRPGAEGTPCVLSAVEASQMYFDFFLECVTASLSSQSCEAYISRMKEGGTKLTEAELALMHEHLSPLDLRGALVSNALFLHFGTILEYPDSSAEALRRGMWPSYVQEGAKEVAQDAGDAQGGVFLINCSGAGQGVRAQRAEGDTSPSSMAWIENCSECSFWLPSTGFNMIVGLHGFTLGEDAPLPDGLCLDGRRWAACPSREAGYCVAVYGAKDSFKAQGTEAAVVFCGVGMPAWLERRGLTAADVWESPPGLDLWTARLFCARGDMDPAEYGAKLRGYWDAGAFDKAWFLAADRYALQQLNDMDSALDRDAQRTAFRS